MVHQTSRAHAIEPESANMSLTSYSGSPMLPP